jgi:hypothetical protein
MFLEVIILHIPVQFIQVIGRLEYDELTHVSPKLGLRYENALELRKKQKTI